ncbi:MAG: YunC family protein [Methanomicrobiaceae archaeon]|nr:YunC family protein [Methanomicrobiaceae archaeon]
MKGEIIRIGKKEIEGFVIPIGKVNLVFARNNRGLVGCGAFDVLALEKFGYAAAKVRPNGESVSNLDDLMTGEISAVNPSAEKLGIKGGMSGKDALNLL